MKKVLFALSLVAAFSFVACNGKSDCVCNITDKTTGEVYMHHNDEDVNGTLDISDFDGDCKDASWSDLPSSSKDWASLNDSVVSYNLVCKDK